MRLTIYHKILDNEQFEGAEFIDDNSFLWSLTPVNVGTCHLWGHSFGQRTANASILMKFRTLHKSRVLNSMIAIVFYDSWRLSNLTLLNIGICHLLGHIFNKSCKNFNLVKFYSLHKSKTLSSMVAVVLCDSWCLSILISANIGTRHVLGHKFGRRTANALILMKLCILHKSKMLSSMVAIVFCSFWRPPVKFRTCLFWHR